MWKKLRNNNKKGFTLVELIVVLVILAILAALLIPALTKYIDKAKEKDVIAKTRQIVMAAQTLADEEYAAISDSTTTVTFIYTGTVAGKTTGQVLVCADTNSANTVEALSEVSGLSATNVSIKDLNLGESKITEVIYWDAGAQKKCTYDGTTYTVVKATALN